MATGADKTMKVSDIENQNNLLLMNVPDTRIKMYTFYTINGEFAEILKNSLGL